MAVLLDIITKGSDDRSVTLRIIDATDGTPETGVVFNTAGIALWYRRELSAKVDITEVTLAALTTAHTDGGFLHIADGEYRLDPPDAAFATGANYVDFGGTVTGMIVIGGRVTLVNYDPEDGVRMGLAALPNAVAGASAGLPLRGNSYNELCVTTIATLASQISFTLTAGSADDDAYNGCVIVVTDQATAQQKCIGIVLDYTGSTKTVTLAFNPSIFTMATGDLVCVLADRVGGGVIRQDTCQTDGSPDSTHAVLDAGASAVDDAYNGLWFAIVKGTGLGQQPRAITDYVGSTKRVTLDPALSTNTDNTTEFAIFQ